MRTASSQRERTGVESLSGSQRREGAGYSAAWRLLALLSSGFEHPVPLTRLAASGWERQGSRTENEKAPRTGPDHLILDVTMDSLDLGILTCTRRAAGSAHWEVVPLTPSTYLVNTPPNLQLRRLVAFFVLFGHGVLKP